MDTIHLAHISDIHISTRSQWQAGDWLNKRMAAWLNLRILGRGLFFRQAEIVLGALLRDLRSRRPDHVIFSGDATALGFEEEVHRAATLLGLDTGLVLPGMDERL